MEIISSGTESVLMKEILVAIIGLTFPIWGAFLFFWIVGSWEVWVADREERYAREYQSRHRQ